MWRHLFGMVLFPVEILLPFFGPAEIVPIDEGYGSKIYLITDYKQNQYLLRTVSDSSFERERRVLAHLNKHNFGPRLIKAFPEQKALVVDYIPGHSLQHFEEELRAEYFSTIDQLRLLHALPPLEEEVRSPISSIRLMYEQLGEPHPIGFDVAMGRVVQMEAALAHHPVCLCHNDFHRKNVIISSEGPRIIDWSTASNGDPYFDLAKFVLFLPEPYKKEMVERYHDGDVNDARLYLAQQQLLLVVALHRYLASEGTASNHLPPATNFLYYPKTKEGFLETSLRALHAFLKGTETDDYFDALARAPEGGNKGNQ